VGSVAEGDAEASLCDLGEAVGIPKEGWREVMRSPGEVLMHLAATTLSAAASLTSVGASKPPEPLAPQGSSAAPAKPAASTVQRAAPQLPNSAEASAAGERAQSNSAESRSSALQVGAGVEEVEDGASGLDREIEMELEAKLEQFRREMAAAREAQQREEQRKERARHKVAAKKEDEQMKKKEILESRLAHDSDAEQSVGEMDPHYIDWMKGDGEDGDEPDAPRRKSRSKSRGQDEKKRKAAAAAAGIPCPLGSGQGQRGRSVPGGKRSQRSKSQIAREKAEEEAAVLAAAPADSSAVPTTPEKEKVRFNKKGKVVKRRGAGRTKGGALSGDESDGESVGNNDEEEKAAAAKRAAAKRTSAKEVARQRERTCWCFCMLFVCEMRSDEIRLW
jgi:hypothetical protein